MSARLASPVLGLALAAALVLAGGAGAAELRRLEVVGAVSADPGPAGEESRAQAALEAALQEAVVRVARGLLLGPDGAEPSFDPVAVLGDDPTLYAVRFRILEDRGERRALLVTEPGVATEYVVLVEVHVDVDRVRERLGAAGLLDAAQAPSGTDAFDLELLELASARAYREIRRALIDDAGALDVVPREIQPGWAVLRVHAPAGARDTVERLLRAPLAEGLGLERLSGGPGTARLRVLEAPPLPGEDETPPLPLGGDDRRAP